MRNKDSGRFTCLLIARQIVAILRGCGRKWKVGLKNRWEKGGRIRGRWTLKIAGRWEIGLQKRWEMGGCPPNS